MSGDEKREVSCVLPSSYQDRWREEYDAWRGSMRVEGRGTTADFLRYLIRIGLEQARRDR